MWCPKCTGKTTVTSTYTQESVIRSRRCIKCNYSFMSKEAIHTDKYWDEYTDYTDEVGAKKKKIEDAHPKQGELF